jgi:hypothetical protein
MQITQEYYGAEIQDVQIEVQLELNTFVSSGVNTGNWFKTYTIFVFNQKILSDTYTVKSTQPINKPIPLSTTAVNLGYTPIITTRGKGGPEASNPYGLIRGFYPDYTFNDEDNYNPNNLTKTKSIKSISTSPAGNLIEVTVTYSIICSTPTKFIIATSK